MNKTSTVFIVDEMANQPLGLYDSATGNSLTAELVIDITAECTRKAENERTYLLFSRDSRTQIVQILSCYADEDFGSQVHFALRHGNIWPPSSLALHSRLLGINVDRLTEIILDFAPV